MHTLTKVPLSVVLRRLPVHTHLTASPNHVCDGDASHTHTRDAETETRRRKRSPTTHSGAWADVAWHGQNRARCFLRRYVKHRGPSVRPYLLPVWRLGGKLLWRCHLVGVSRSQHERIHRVKGGRERETCILLLMFRVASGNCCPFSQIYIILLYRGNMLTDLCT